MATKLTKWYANTFGAASAISGTVGTLIAAMDAFLVNGFNQNTLTSLVVASNVATGTKTSHGYVVDQIVTISGATPSSLNGDWRIASVATDTFAFVTSGISDQTATGTIVAITSGLGWQKQFSDTNLAVYRSTAAGATQVCIKVDDTTAQYATITCAESFTDINTPVNTVGTRYFYKSSTANGTARAWVVAGDNKTVYFGIDWNSGGAITSSGPLDTD